MYCAGSATRIGRRSCTSGKRPWQPAHGRCRPCGSAASSERQWTQTGCGGWLLGMAGVQCTAAEVPRPPACPIGAVGATCSRDFRVAAVAIANRSHSCGRSRNFRGKALGWPSGDSSSAPWPPATFPSSSTAVCASLGLVVRRPARSRCYVMGCRWRSGGCAVAYPPSPERGRPAPERRRLADRPGQQRDAAAPPGAGASRPRAPSARRQARSAARRRCSPPRSGGVPPPSAVGSPTGPFSSETPLLPLPGAGASRPRAPSARRQARSAARRRCSHSPERGRPAPERRRLADKPVQRRDAAAPTPRSGGVPPPSAVGSPTGPFSSETPLLPLPGAGVSRPRAPSARRQARSAARRRCSPERGRPAPDPSRVAFPRLAMPPRWGLVHQPTRRCRHRFRAWLAGRSDDHSRPGP